MLSGKKCGKSQEKKFAKLGLDKSHFITEIAILSKMTITIATHQNRIMTAATIAPPQTSRNKFFQTPIKKIKIHNTK